MSAGDAASRAATGSGIVRAPLGRPMTPIPVARQASVLRWRRRLFAGLIRDDDDSGTKTGVYKTLTRVCT